MQQDQVHRVSLPAHSQYAGFWKRFAAHLIDHAIIATAGIVFLIPFIGMLGLGAFSFGDEEIPLGFVLALIGAYLGAIVLIIIASWLYFALMESSRGATLGKMALGIIVTDMSGNPISFGRASGRYFAKFISGLPFGIGYIMAGFTQQKQALHDIIAGCLVIEKSHSVPL